MFRNVEWPDFADCKNYETLSTSSGYLSSRLGNSLDRADNGWSFREPLGSGHFQGQQDEQIDHQSEPATDRCLPFDTGADR